VGRAASLRFHRRICMIIRATIASLCLGLGATVALAADDAAAPQRAYGGPL
jgi:hypothetical protein